jgi:hypothetical protein
VSPAEAQQPDQYGSLKEQPKEMIGDMTTTMGEPHPGTAGWLADYLAGQPRDRKIVIAKDSEGNDHSPLADASEAMYQPDQVRAEDGSYEACTWAGSTYLTPEQLAEEMAAPNLQGWSDEDAAPEGAVRVIVLGPVN